MFLKISLCACRDWIFSKSSSPVWRDWIFQRIFTWVWRLKLSESVVENEDFNTKAFSDSGHWFQRFNVSRKYFSGVGRLDIRKIFPGCEQNQREWAFQKKEETVSWVMRYWVFSQEFVSNNLEFYTTEKKPKFRFVGLENVQNRTGNPY